MKLNIKSFYKVSFVTMFVIIGLSAWCGSVLAACSSYKGTIVVLDGGCKSDETYLEQRDENLCTYSRICVPNCIQTYPPICNFNETLVNDTGVDARGCQKSPYCQVKTIDPSKCTVITSPICNSNEVSVTGALDGNGCPTASRCQLRNSSTYVVPSAGSFNVPQTPTVTSGGYSGGVYVTPYSNFAPQGQTFTPSSYSGGNSNYVAPPSNFDTQTKNVTSGSYSGGEYVQPPSSFIPKIQIATSGVYTEANSDSSKETGTSTTKKESTLGIMGHIKNAFIGFFKFFRFGK